MTAKHSLDSSVSQAVVEHMAHVLGHLRTVEVLGISEARLAAFLAGRGRLAEVQAHRIAAMTRRTWPLWALDAAEQGARTLRQRELVAANQVMRDHYERFAPAEIAEAERVLGLASAARDEGPRVVPRPRPSRRSVAVPRRRATA